jgi:hypothetical protein
MGTLNEKARGVYAMCSPHTRLIAFIHILSNPHLDYCVGQLYKHARPPAVTPLHMP